LKSEQFSYLQYWHGKISADNLKEFASVIDSRTPEGGLFYLLSDVLPEDQKLREALKQDLLVTR